MGMDQGSGQEEMTAMARHVAEALRSLARRMDAAILLMPTYNVAHEADVRECNRLKEYLGGVPAHVALLSDPALYKAVAGQTKLMVSARMHPLILAAGMGVPIVGLAYNGKFEGLFRLLGLQREVLWLNQLKQGVCQQSKTAADIEQLAADALNDRTDLQHRAALLAQSVQQSTHQLIESALAA